MALFPSHVPYLRYNAGLLNLHQLSLMFSNVNNHRSWCGCYSTEEGLNFTNHQNHFSQLVYDSRSSIRETNLYSRIHHVLSTRLHSLCNILSFIPYILDLVFRESIPDVICRAAKCSVCHI